MFRPTSASIASCSGSNSPFRIWLPSPKNDRGCNSSVAVALRIGVCQESLQVAGQRRRMAAEHANFGKRHFRRNNRHAALPCLWLKCARGRLNRSSGCDNDGRQVRSVADHLPADEEQFNLIERGADRTFQERHRVGTARPKRRDDLFAFSMGEQLGRSQCENDLHARRQIRQIERRAVGGRDPH